MESQTVSEAHLHYSLANTTHTWCIGRNSLTGTQQRSHTTIDIQQRIRVGQTVRIICRAQTNNFVTYLLKFRRNYLRHLTCGNGKRYQCGRYIQILKGTGHGVLAADGTNA